MITVFQLPAGRYYIGDPCYVLQASWDRIKTAFDENEPVEFDGYTVWGANTAFGDGCYKCSRGSEYMVDSGILAAIPVQLIDNPNGEEHGTIIDEPNGLMVEYDLNGTFTFGSICIKTGDDGAGNDYEEYDDDDHLEF
jgi:hypothetical protein